MLELMIGTNTWEPPELSEEEVMRLIADKAPYTEDNHERLLFLRIRPYIDAIYVDYKYKGDPGIGRFERFVFHEDYAWTPEQESMFSELCLNNPDCRYKYGFFDEIYDYYNEMHPDWKLKRYYTESVRLLDHIYHCMRKNTVKELLYKSGLDMLAKHAGGHDDLDLLSSTPCEVYDGISMRTLRSMNCDEGGKILCSKKVRKVIKQLAMQHQDFFDQPLNDAQCIYLGYLCEKDLTTKEIGRLYPRKRDDLSYLWNKRQLNDYFLRIKREDRLAELVKIDRIYEKLNDDKYKDDLVHIVYYLLEKRDEFDRRIRVSNRIRDPDWQERDHGYVVRYPQTINDYCRNAVSMSNCLMGYLDMVTDNITTILFMRKNDAVNEPFIAIEIYKNELVQAYRSYNRDCTKIEAEWIRDYCKRHEISCDRFAFDKALDMA